MSKFSDPRDALEFLIAQIVAEAEFEAFPLSEIERRMLYFSETAWVPPDMVDTAEAFDRPLQRTRLRGEDSAAYPECTKSCLPRTSARRMG